MTQMVRNHASAMGLRIRITDTGTEIIIEVIGKRKIDEIQHTDQVTVAG
jgi:hypothetical protein